MMKRVFFKIMLPQKAVCIYCKIDESCLTVQHKSVNILVVICLRPLHMSLRLVKWWDKIQNTAFI